MTSSSTSPTSAASVTLKQRASQHDCARCGRDHSFYRRWPEGNLCRTCVLAAIALYGVCPSCGQDRILPGHEPAGRPICPTCAGIRHSTFRCRRCSVEGRLYHGKPCVRCTLTDRIAAVLDEGTGTIHPALVPLATALATGPPTPAARLVWLPNLTTTRCCARSPPASWR